MAENLLFDLGLIIVAATMLGLLASRLKQPLIIGYVIAGMIIGPPIFGFITNLAPVQLLSELGIALLLFIIGLELDLKRVREVGLKSSLLGIMQVGGTTLIGFFILRLLGFASTVSFYFALILSFSSTILLVKLLNEKKELESLHGQLVLGVLVIQDILAILALSLIELSRQPGANAEFFLFFVLKAIGFIIVAYLTSKYIMPPLIRETSRTVELTFITALTFVFIFGSFAVVMGFSFAIGAFAAGLIFSSNITNAQISARLTPLRDFFLVLFFVTFGMQMMLGTPGRLFAYMIPLFAIILLIKPAATYISSRILGFGQRTSFMSSLILAQSSEFGLVLAALGLSLGHLDNTQVSAISIVTLATMVFSAYLVKYDQKLFENFKKRKFFGEEKVHYHKNYESSGFEKLKGHYVIFGFHPLTVGLLNQLRRENKKVLVADHNPEKVKEVAGMGIPSILIELNNVDAYEKLNIEKAKAVISTINHLHGNLTLIAEAKRINPKALVMVTARDNHDHNELIRAGADFVAIPLLLSGKEIGDHLLSLENPKVRRKVLKKELTMIEEVEEELRSEEKLIKTMMKNNTVQDSPKNIRRNSNKSRISGGNKRDNSDKANRKNNTQKRAKRADKKNASKKSKNKNNKKNKQ